MISWKYHWRAESTDFKLRIGTFFPVKSQVVFILGFAGYTVSVKTIQLFFSSAKNSRQFKWMKLAMF